MWANGGCGYSCTLHMAHFYIPQIYFYISSKKPVAKSLGHFYHILTPDNCMSDGQQNRNLAGYSLQGNTPEINRILSIAAKVLESKKESKKNNVDYVINAQLQMHSSSYRWLCDVTKASSINDVDQQITFRAYTDFCLSENKTKIIPWDLQAKWKERRMHNMYSFSYPYMFMKVGVQ